MPRSDPPPDYPAYNAERLFPTLECLWHGAALPTLRKGGPLGEENEYPGWMPPASVACRQTVVVPNGLPHCRRALLLPGRPHGGTEPAASSGLVDADGPDA